MRRIMGVLSLIVLTLTVLIIILNLRYPIKNVFDDLEKDVLTWVNRHNKEGDVAKQTVEVIGWVDFDNKRHTAILLDHQLGEVRLIRGLNGGYRIDSTGGGSGRSFRYRIEEGKKENHLIFTGKNRGLKISKITFVLDHKTYELEVPETEYYMIHVEVDQHVHIGLLDVNTLRFYDKEDNDLTEEIWQSRD